MGTFLALQMADQESFLALLEERERVQQREGAPGGLQLAQSNADNNNA